jgi:Druantia protein DruA
MQYCGRSFSTPDIELIQSLITDGLNRSHLSRRFCEKTGWRKPDGGLKEMSCRVALLRMERDGHVVLPPPQRPANNHLKKPKEIALPVPTTENARELVLELVNRTTSALWNAYIDRYHYLGYTPLPGAQLRYFVRSEGTILALLGFAAAAWKCAPRDDAIGWNATTRKKNLHLVLNNARFLILVKVQNLASRILALTAKRIVTDWHSRYGYAPVLLETFVDTERFTGTCYKASNWISVGATQGRGKLDRYHEHKLPVKSVWLYPLRKEFRRCLNG